MAAGDVHAHQDCAAVVNELNRPLHIQLRHDHVNAGMIRALLKEDGRAYIKSLTKVKAHGSRKDAAHCPTLLRHYLGNDAADKVAKAARARHPKPTREVELKVTCDLERETVVLNLAAALLPLWEPVSAEEKSSAAKRPRGPKLISRLPTSHKWKMREQGWRCARCWAYAGTLARRVSRRDEPCPGKLASLQQVAARPQGHCLMAGDVRGSPLLICVKCGAWSSAVPRLLAAPCPNVKSAAGAIALSLFQSGWSPEPNPAQRRRVSARRKLNPSEPSWQAPFPEAGFAQFQACSVAADGSRLAALWRRIRAKEMGVDSV